MKQDDDRFLNVPFVDHLGITIHSSGKGTSELIYTPLEAHMNNLGITHGGALMTLLDVAMARAARSESEPYGVITVEMKTTFMRPAVGALIARGELLHSTATMAFTQGTVFDSSGKACAHATGTFKFLKRPFPNV